jgi:TonB family protein
LKEWKRTPAPATLDARVFSRKLIVPRWWDRVPASVTALSGVAAGGLVVYGLSLLISSHSTPPAAFAVAPKAPAQIVIETPALKELPRPAPKILIPKPAAPPSPSVRTSATPLRPQGALLVPGVIMVDGQPMSLQDGRVFLFFFDPECSSCFTAAKSLGQLKFRDDITVVAVPTRVPQFAAALLADAKFKAKMSSDGDKLRGVLKFDHPPYAVLLDRGRQIGAITPAQFNQADPAKLSSILQELGAMATAVISTVTSSAPRLVSRPSVIFPAGAEALAVTTSVKLHIRIGKDGHVIEATVTEGDPVLNDAALEAVKGWVYQPYLLNGEPTEQTADVVVDFRPVPRTAPGKAKPPR